MKATYKNVIRSKKLIREAVIELLKEKKDINLISITDIVNKANINRGTFYNHYDNIKDVLNEIEDELMEELTVAVNKLNPAREDANGAFFDALTVYFKQKEDQFKMIIPYVPRYVFNDLKIKILDLCNRFFFGSTNVDKNRTVVLALVANGIAGTYLDYFENRSKYSLEDIAAAIKVLMKKML